MDTPRRPGERRRYRPTPLLTLALVLGAAGAAAQESGAGWTFETDELTELWFHGLAAVGYEGGGAQPLYDRAYAAHARGGGGGADALDPETLEALRRAFGADPAFEVLHFVPLYFRGIPRVEALRLLERVADGYAGSARPASGALVGGDVVAALLRTPEQRRALGRFLRLLDAEWTRSVGPRIARERARERSLLEALRDEWASRWLPALAGHLGPGDLRAATVVVTPTLGNEGRFLGGAAGPGTALVAVGRADGEDPVALTLGALVRELCYPVVRRIMAPFEERLGGTRDASLASDLSATRCGVLLIERALPAHVAAYRSRFGLPSGEADGTFLSAAGAPPAVAALEAELDRALRRELNLDPDVGRAGARSVGRNR